MRNSLDQFVKHVDCMDKAYELPVVHRAFFAPRFEDTKPGKCELFGQFSALAGACAGWVKEDGMK